MTIDFASLVKETAERMNKVASAAHGGPGLYVASPAAPKTRQPCRCELRPYPHKLDRHCEALADQPLLEDDAHEEYDPDAWQADRRNDDV